MCPGLQEHLRNPGSPARGLGDQLGSGGSPTVPPMAWLRENIPSLLGKTGQSRLDTKASEVEWCPRQ